MKSDQEFIKGIYDKAEEIRNQEASDEIDSKVIRKAWTYLYDHKPTYIYRYGTLAAVFLVLIVATIYFNLPRQSSIPVKPEPFGIDPKDTRSLDILDILFQSSTDVVEVGYSNSTGKEVIGILHVYQGDSEAKELLSVIKAQRIELQKGQSAIIFLQESNEGLILMETFRSDETTKDTYTNQYGDSITKEELEK